MTEFFHDVMWTHSTGTFLLAFAAVVLFFAHMGTLAAFALDIFFDTEVTTANERAQSIFRYIAYVAAIWIALAVIIMVLIRRISAEV